MHIIFRANQTLQSLTKNIENNTNIYNTKCMYINIFHDNSNNINLTLYIFIFLSVYIIKIYKIWLWPNLICKIFWAEGSTFVDLVHPLLVIKWLVGKIIDSSNSTAFFVSWSLPWNGPIFPRTHRSRSFFFSHHWSPIQVVSAPMSKRKKKLVSARRNPPKSNRWLHPSRMNGSSTGELGTAVGLEEHGGRPGGRGGRTF
jgi:hypothetical protein